MDGGACWAAVHGVAEDRTRLSDFTFTFHFHALYKEMATHSSILAWRIPWTEGPSRLESMGSQRVRHDWATFTFFHFLFPQLDCQGMAGTAFLHTFVSLCSSSSMCKEADVCWRAQVVLDISLVVQMVRNLPAMQEPWVRSLDQEDLLEKGMATYSSILAWEIPWTEEPSGL